MRKQPTIQNGNWMIYDFEAAGYVDTGVRAEFETADGGFAGGNDATAESGGAVGSGAIAGDGFAGGKNAATKDADGAGIDAIQLGTGTNSVPKSLQVYDYQLMDADGNVPLARIPQLSEKVDKVSGKGLSTNDYTDAEQEKLAGIEAGAEVNTVKSVCGKTGAVALGKEDVGLGNVDNTADLEKPVSAAMQAALSVKADKQNEYGGFAAGDRSESTEGGGAVGYNTYAFAGGAIGNAARTTNAGGAVGANSEAGNGGAVGEGAKTSSGFAGGAGAQAVSADGAGIDAIQLGTGTNSTPKTLQVYSYQLMDADGNIPSARIPQLAEKVDKVSGKGLSTNDFEDAYKDLLDQLPNIKIINSTSKDGFGLELEEGLYLVNEDYSYEEKTESTDGIIGVIKYYHKRDIFLLSVVRYWNESEPVTIGGTRDFLKQTKYGYDEVKSRVIKRTKHSYSGDGDIVELSAFPNGSDTEFTLESDWVQLIDADGNIPSARIPQLSEKVDKIEGKGLSTNDYTDAEQAKVGNLPEDTQSALDEKADKQNEHGGFAGGIVASAESGGAVGWSASAESGGAVGYGAAAVSGGAVGNDASVFSGGAVGWSASAVGGGAIGFGAFAGDGFSGGYNAKVKRDSYNSPIDAIQLGDGINSVPKSLKVYSHTVMNADGSLPYVHTARPYVEETLPAAGEVLALNTIYDLGTQTSVTLKLPSANVGNFIQVDFLCGDTPATFTIDAASSAIVSDYDFTPEPDKAYSLFFDYGRLAGSLYGWRFSYAEYTYTEV